MAKVAVFARYTAETLVTWSVAASFLTSVAGTFLEKMNNPVIYYVLVR